MGRGTIPQLFLPGTTRRAPVAPWLLILRRYYETSLGMICACLPTLPVLGKTATAQRILNSRLFSFITSNDATRSEGGSQGGGFMRYENDSSTARLANQGIRVDTEISIFNTCELQDNQRTRGM